MRIFLIFYNMKVYCVSHYNRLVEAILMSTHNIPFSTKKENTPNYTKPAAKGFFLGTQVRVRNSRGKRAISVRATVLCFTLL